VEQHRNDTPCELCNESGRMRSSPGDETADPAGASQMALRLMPPEQKGAYYHHSPFSLPKDF